MLGHFGSGLSEIVLFVVCENREKLNYFYLFLFYFVCSSTTVRGTYLNKHFEPVLVCCEFLDAISISIVGSVGHSHSHRLFAIYHVQSVIIFEFKVL